MVKSKWAMVTITAVFLLVQIVVMFGIAHKGHSDYIRSVMVTTGFWIGYSVLEARYDFAMSTYVRTLMVLSIFMDAFFGYYYDLYATSFVFDKMLHVFGTYSFSLFGYVLMVQWLKSPLPAPFKFILITAIGLSFGTLYEILEFFTDSISHPYPPSQPSLLDTDVDLIGDFIGAVAAAVHALYRKFLNRIF